MKIFLIILLSLSALFCLYLYLIWPGKHRKGIFSSFKGTYIAHRGLHNKADIPENSMKAFQAAIDIGYPIELDVQLSADEELVVFHDETLKRVCSDPRRVHECTYEELLGLSLLGTGEKIPLFSEVLSFVDGRVPLLIEVKYYKDPVKVTKETAKRLRGYRGVYAVQSFHPSVINWYRRNRPEIPRGLLSTDYNEKKDKRPFLQRVILSNLLLNFYAKPDFISYEHKYADQLTYRLIRKLWRVENVCWTIRRPRDLERARKVFSTYIFEGFIPE